MPHHASPAPHPLTYRRIAISFIALTAALAALALTLTLSRARVVITPKETPQRIEASIAVETAPLALAQDAVPGTVEIRTIMLEGKAPLKGGTEVPDKAGGSITVINTSARNQPLIATTRFLSVKGILFRSIKTINVPAKGKTEVEVRADKAGAEGNIPAGKFTIPGLSGSLQSQIYGESSKPMSGGVRTVTKVVEADISKASASLASAVEAHRFSLEQALKGKDAVVGMEKINETVTTPIGKEAEAAVIKGTYREVIVQYDRTALDELLASMMERRVEYAAAIQTQEPVITFDKTIDGGATIAVVQNGTVSAPFDPEKINTKLITGKKITDSEEIVKTMPGVGGVEITVKPKFLRRLPRLRDHIEIIVGED